jgi:CheY-like chemotaxis protein
MTSWAVSPGKPYAVNTTVRLDFPGLSVEPSAGRAGANCIRPMAPALPQCAMARRLRVLVADDNEDAANTLAALLELCGYHVQVVYDGEAAVQLAKRWPPDAAILDISMPGRNGYEVAEFFRSWLPQETVLVAHSGQLTIPQRDAAAASLFDLCFTKGADFAELEEQLEVRLKGMPAGRLTASSGDAKSPRPMH